MHAYRIHPVEWLREGFTAGFHVPLNWMQIQCTHKQTEILTFTLAQVNSHTHAKKCICVSMV